MHLAHVLVDNRHVRRHIDAAVLLRRRETEHVVVLVDGAAHRRQAVVAVGQHIGKWKSLHAGGLGRLDDAHKGDVMGCHRIKTQAQMLHVFRAVMGLQNGPGDGTFFCFRLVRIPPAAGTELLCLLLRDDLSVYQVHASVI